MKCIILNIQWVNLGCSNSRTHLVNGRSERGSDLCVSGALGRRFDPLLHSFAGPEWSCRARDAHTLRQTFHHPHTWGTSALFSMGHCMYTHSKPSLTLSTFWSSEEKCKIFHLYQRDSEEESCLAIPFWACRGRLWGIVVFCVVLRTLMPPSQLYTLGDERFVFLIFICTDCFTWIYPFIIIFIGAYEICINK